jgi:hypothetical protein
MMTKKTLMLAGVTALSIGASAAMAQEGGSNYPVTPDYWAPSSIQAREARTAGAVRIQAGSSDVEPTPAGTAQPPMNWLNLPSYGGQG